jgi:hypothetical protein
VIREETMPHEPENERKLEAIKTMLADQGKWHGLVLTIVTVLAVAVLGILLLEILDMRHTEPR